MSVIDTNVQVHFRYNSEIRRYISPAHKLRAIPDVELQWYQAPGGDYRTDLYGDGYPGSNPETVTRHLFEEGGVDYAILNPPTRGNIADYLLNSRICAAVNDWLVDRWLEPDVTDRFYGTIRVNPENSETWTERRSSRSSVPKTAGSAMNAAASRRSSDERTRNVCGRSVISRRISR